MHLLCSLPSTRLKPNFEVLPCPGAFSSPSHTAKALVICEHLPLLSFPAACFLAASVLPAQLLFLSPSPTEPKESCVWMAAQLLFYTLQVRDPPGLFLHSFFFLSLLFFELPPLLLVHFSPSMLDTCTWLMLGEDESLWVLHKWGILFIDQVLWSFAASQPQDVPRSDPPHTEGLIRRQAWMAQTLKV